MKSFNELGIEANIIKAIEELGFNEPMPVQEEVIPHLLDDTTKDIIALAQTGTGKTAAFGIPLIQNSKGKPKYVTHLILSPTRELCLQIADDLKDFAKYKDEVRITAVFGGSSIDNQINTLRRGVHIVSATPGRLVDLINRNKIDLSKIETLVLDEADEMLNMGFREELDAIIDQTPKDRTTLLFSATMPKEVSAISKKYMKSPTEITIGKRNTGAINVSHQVYVVHAKDRYLALKRIVDFHPDIYGIVFCRTRRETQEIAEKLIKDGYNADSLHGDLSQAQRDAVMNK
ncbi:MAG: DEAD/DEAH box helicase, partial [Melioribacteraceae bacterium]|nr:DEAD/DEAH box helicase [Melioribacteraceae bacterium]